MRMMLHPASKATLLQGRQTAAWQMLTLIALLCLLPLHLRAAPYCSLSSSPTLDFPLYSISFKIAPRENQSIRIPIYGRVPAGQNLPAGTPYRDIPYGSYVRYSYGYIHAPTESNCRDRIPGHVGGAGDISFNWSGVQANVLRSCRISTGKTLDFGTGAGLRSAREQSMPVQLNCTANVAWQAALDDGLHAQAGKRFMAAGGERVGYELYRDPSRLSRWGNTQSSAVSGTGSGVMQDMTVYGQVPAQADAMPGTYTDTVTMRLTY